MDLSVTFSVPAAETRWCHITQAGIGRRCAGNILGIGCHGAITVCTAGAVTVSYFLFLIEILEPSFQGQSW